MSLEIFAVSGVGEITSTSDLVSELLGALEGANQTILDGDVVAVTSKVVAKSEGRVVPFDGTDENKSRLIEQESRRILRRRGALRITETYHGFVCANAGIDLSNTIDGTAVLLPLDPDRSARRFRGEVARRRNINIAVVITDTFGRPWRNGVSDVAIGSAGLRPIQDLRGTADAYGRILEATEVAIVDEIAGAVDLVLGKANATPFAVLRGLDASHFGDGSVREQIVRSPNEDLFR